MRKTYFSKKGIYHYMKRVKKNIHYYCEGTTQKRYLGKGMVVVVMDSGACEHPELSGRFLFFRDFIYGKETMYDDNGHGTHVCGIIAGKTIGVAPESKLIVLKVLDELGNGSVETSLQAFRWVLENREKYNIRIINISMGMKPKTNILRERQILRGVEVLWDMGIIVVAAAGNQGPNENSITVPGFNRKIITVGAYDLKYSGRGAWDKHLEKPDLVAPGYHILSCNSRWKENGQSILIHKSGTSMATPIVSGVIADLLSKEPSVSNERVKELLYGACDDLKMPNERQGKGMLNVKRLLD